MQRIIHTWADFVKVCIFCICVAGKILLSHNDNTLDRTYGTKLWIGIGRQKHRIQHVMDSLITCKIIESTFIQTS